MRSLQLLTSVALLATTAIADLVTIDFQRGGTDVSCAKSGNPAVCTITETFDFAEIGLPPGPAIVSANALAESSPGAFHLRLEAPTGFSSFFGNWFLSGTGGFDDTLTIFGPKGGTGFFDYQLTQPPPDGMSLDAITPQHSPFEFNQPFDIYFQGTAFTDSAFCFCDGGFFEGMFSVGDVQIFDSHGHQLTGFKYASNAGPLPVEGGLFVPEPSSLLLLTMATGMVLFVSRLRSTAGR